MKTIKKIEIRDGQKTFPSALIQLPDLINKIENADTYQWAILFFDAFYYSEEAKNIAGYINDNIRKEKIIPVTWKEVTILSKDIGQWSHLKLIGCKDPKNLKYYSNDDEMIKSCDLVIINFDGCWWEISCKDEDLMKKFMTSFKEVKVIPWEKSPPST